MNGTKIPSLIILLFPSLFPFLSLGPVFGMVKLAFGPLRAGSCCFKSGADIAMLLPALSEQRDNLFYFTPTLAIDFVSSERISRKYTIHMEDYQARRQRSINTNRAEVISKNKNYCDWVGPLS